MDAYENAYIYHILNMSIASCRPDAYETTHITHISGILLKEYLNNVCNDVFQDPPPPRPLPRFSLISVVLEFGSSIQEGTLSPRSSLRSQVPRRAPLLFFFVSILRYLLFATSLLLANKTTKKRHFRCSSCLYVYNT